MIDSVLKGNGNSRFLKSAVPAGTSWTDALAMLQAGTFPIDFNGINTEGFQQVGTPLNKANLLKDATAAQIGLPPSTTPDGMFQALGNTGELHVWRKTVKNAADVPAGYTLSSVNVGSYILYIGNTYHTISYSSSVSVDDSGNVSLKNPTTISNAVPSTDLSFLKGAFMVIPVHDADSSFSQNVVYYIPANVTITRDGQYIYLDRYQLVTGYPLTPAGTTTTYPVSTNPNAYQEGDDAKAAGYTLGEVVSGNFRFATNSNHSVWYHVSDSLNVADNGAISLGAYERTSMRGGTDYSAIAGLKGKFIQLESNDYAGYVSSPFSNLGIYYVPSDAVFSDGPSTDRYQPVTGYPAIPAGTTIEYLGKLGDKARVQVVSYVGTGTNSSETPNSLVFDFAPKIVFILGWINTNSNFCQGMLSPLLDYGFCMTSGYSGYGSSAYLTVKSSGNKITWTGKDPYYQLNESGAKYYAVAIG